MAVFDRFLKSIKINDDEDYEEEEFFDEEDDIEEEDDYTEDKPAKRRLFGRRGKKKRDFDDDEYFDEADEDAAPKKTSRFFKRSSAPKETRTPEPAPAPRQAAAPVSKVTPMRRRGGAGMEVRVIKPTTMEDTREIADTLLSNCTVIINLEGMDVELAQRVIDFSSGACYAIDGGLQKVSSYIFILTPANVDISGDFTDLLSGAAPSIRTGI